MHDPNGPSGCKSPSVLVIVHAGSACGSANFNLGNSDARCAREFLTRFIDGWNSHVIVIDGSLCDELEFYPHLGGAIADALGRAEGRDLISLRKLGEDPGQVDVIREIVQNLNLPKDTPFEVTGAWASHGEEGCVNSVYDALHELGYTRATVSDSAVFINDDDEDLEGETEDEDAC